MDLGKEWNHTGGEKFCQDVEEKEDISSLYLMRGNEFPTAQRQDERLTRVERITKKKDFERIFKIGTKRKAIPLTLIHTPSTNRRIGIVLDRHIKGSVIRNKLKRRLRDIYRRNKVNFNGEYIVLAYKGTELMSYSELCEKILKLLR